MAKKRPSSFVVEVVQCMDAAPKDKRKLTLRYFKGLDDYNLRVTLNKAITDLEENGDIQLTTARHLVINYMLKLLKKRHINHGEEARGRKKWK